VSTGGRGFALTGRVRRQGAVMLSGSRASGRSGVDWADAERRMMARHEAKQRRDAERVAREAAAAEAAHRASGRR